MRRVQRIVSLRGWRCPLLLWGPATAGCLRPSSRLTSSLREEVKGLDYWRELLVGLNSTERLCEGLLPKVWGLPRRLRRLVEEEEGEVMVKSSSGLAREGVALGLVRGPEAN